MVDTKQFVRKDDRQARQAPPRSAETISAEQLTKMRRNARDRRRSAAKKEELQLMRRVVKDLERKKKMLLKQPPSNGSTRPTGSQLVARARNPTIQGLCSSMIPASSSTPISLKDYMVLTAEVEAYRCENARLANQLVQRDLFCGILRTGVLAFEQEAALNEPRFTPLTHQEAMSAMRQTLRYITSARLLYADDVSFQNRPKLFGWNQYCERNGGAINFAVKELMPNVTPRELAATSWRVLTDGDVLNSLSPSELIRARVTLLQKINDNVQILDRRMKDGAHVGVGGQPLFLRTVYMAFRTFESDGSVTLAMKTVDLPLVKRLLRDDEAWCDNFYWMHYSSGVYGGIPMVKAEFGGANSYASEEFAALWLKEVLFLAIRWETLVSPTMLTT